MFISLHLLKSVLVSGLLIRIRKYSIRSPVRKKALLDYLSYEQTSAVRKVQFSPSAEC